MNDLNGVHINCVTNPHLSRSCVVGSLTVRTTGFATIENTKEMGFSQLIEAMAFVTQVSCGNNESQNASIECREDGLNQTCIIS